jgi:hypothetical protein
MHVEAMNWSGMGVREYVAALRLSPYPLRKWRDRLDEREVEIDWRSHLHPSACSVVGTSASQSAAESSLTAPSNDAPQAPSTSARRFFSDEQKLAIAMESRQPGATVSGAAHKHGIVTGAAVPLARTVRRGAKETREACARRSRREHGGDPRSA